MKNEKKNISKTRISIFAGIIFCILIILIADRINESKIKNVSRIDGNSYVCSYNGTAHDFVLDLPENHEGAPLVLMLHGYGGCAKAFRSELAISDLAKEKGYALAFVTGSQSSNDKTAAFGWNSGMGDDENNDVEFLREMAKYLQGKYKLDADNTFAVGFSNGGFMVHKLAMEADDTFRAVVSVAGTMSKSVWDNRQKNISVGVFQVTGEKDDVVPKQSDGSDKYSQAPAIEKIMQYWINVNELEPINTCTDGKNSILTVYAGADTDKQVWDLFIPDGRHAWPDKNITGVDINQRIFEFLDANKVEK